MDETVIGDAACLDAARSSFLEHLMQGFAVDFERDVQVVIVLRFELEGAARHLEEGEKRPVAQPVEAMQHTGFATGLGLADLEGVGEP